MMSVAVELRRRTERKDNVLTDKKVGPILEKLLFSPLLCSALLTVRGEVFTSHSLAAAALHSLDQTVYPVLS